MHVANMMTRFQSTIRLQAFSRSLGAWRVWSVAWRQSPDAQTGNLACVIAPAILTCCRGREQPRARQHRCDVFILNAGRRRRSVRAQRSIFGAGGGRPCSYARLTHCSASAARCCCQVRSYSARCRRSTCSGGRRARGWQRRQMGQPVLVLLLQHPACVKQSYKVCSERFDKLHECSVM